MVAPFRHVAALNELTDEEMLELMRLARRAVAAQRTAMTPDGFNVGLNLGKVAGAGIDDHLHLHGGAGVVGAVVGLDGEGVGRRPAGTTPT